MVTFHSGTGTESDPYTIKSDSRFTAIEQLQLIGDALYVGGGYYFKLLEDIDCTGITWTDIGTSSIPFNGKLNGDGHAIQNLINNSFFLFGDSCIIKNIIFKFIDSDGRLIHIGSSSLCECCGFECNSTNGLYRSCIMINWGNNTTIRNCYMIQDSFVSFYNNVDSAYNAYSLTSGSGNTSGYIENCYVKTNSVTIQGIRRTKTGVSAFAVRTGYNTTKYNISNCVGMIGTCTTLGCDGYNQYRGRICSNWGHEGSYSLTGINNYALETSMGITSGSTTDCNGANVSQSTLNTQSFWENTMGWDFENIWYWDTESNLPKLNFKKASIYLKSNNTWVQGEPYIKANNQWIQAESVYVKVNGVWQLQTD